MDEVAVKGLHRIEVKDSNGDPDEAVNWTPWCGPLEAVS
jgi:hypothetical protein